MSTQKSTTKRKTLTQKFVLLFALLLAILFVVLLAVVQIIAQVYTDKYVNNDILSAHTDVDDEFTALLDEINYGYTRLSKNDGLSVFLNDLSKEEAQEVFLKIIADSALSDDYINVALSINGAYYTVDEKYDRPRNSFVNTLISGGNKLYMGDVSNDGYITIGRRFQDLAHSLEGYVVFYISQAKINNITELGNLGKGTTRIVDLNLNVIASSDGNNVGSTIFEGDKYKLNEETYRININGESTLMAITLIDNQYDMDLYTVSEISVYSLQKDFIILDIVLAIIAVIALLASIIISVYLAKRTAKPIKELSSELANVDFSSKRSIFKVGTAGDELYELEKSYNDMLERLFVLMDENKQNMETQRKLEIDALQMQINPHFLYNTLDAIAWMSKIKKQHEIEWLVMNLAKFFRLSLHKGEKYIKIKEEAELIEHFLEIEKVRFPDTIKYVNNIPEDIGDYLTVKLILQPIAENSIKHGFVGKEGIGTITVSAELDGDDILISVSDDGIGFDIPEDFWSRQVDGPNGYGLRNVNERIRLEYGEGYGLTITSQKGVGTTVTARIKKRL